MAPKKRTFEIPNTVGIPPLKQCNERQKNTDKKHRKNMNIAISMIQTKLDQQLEPSQDFYANFITNQGSMLLTHNPVLLNCQWIFIDGLAGLIVW